MKFIKLEEGSVNRIIAHHNEHRPMLFVSADRLDDEDYGNSFQVAQRRKRIKQDLKNKVRTLGYGYNSVRGGYINNLGQNNQAFIDGEHSFIVFGEPTVESQELLRKIAYELGIKYNQETVGFSDINGYIYYIDTRVDENGRLKAPKEKPFARIGNDGTLVNYGTAEISKYAWRDIKKGLSQYYTSFTRSAKPEHNANRQGRTLYFEGLEFSEPVQPDMTFAGRQLSLRWYMAVKDYCRKHWNKDANTYEWDNGWNKLWEVDI